MTQSDCEFSLRFSNSDSEAVLNFDCCGGGGFFLGPGFEEGEYKGV